MPQSSVWQKVGQPGSPPHGPRGLLVTVVAELHLAPKQEGSQLGWFTPFTPREAPLASSGGNTSPPHTPVLPSIWPLLCFFFA